MSALAGGLLDGGHGGGGGCSARWPTRGGGQPAVPATAVTAFLATETRGEQSWSTLSEFLETVQMDSRSLSSLLVKADNDSKVSTATTSRS